MTELRFELDGAAQALARPALHRGGRVLVPLADFCSRLGAELRDVDGRGSLAVCSGDDLCLILQPADRCEMEGELFAYLDAFGEALGLRWEVSGEALAVRSGAAALAGTAVGLGLGQRPPGIRLPDLYTGDLVSADVYRGKPAVFYMWASW